MRDTLRPLAAEFLGTFALVFVGAGAVIVHEATGEVGLVGIAIAHAVVLAVMVTATMRISGGHINPAVTFAIWAAGRIKLQPALLYMATQVTAGIVAVLALQWLYPSAPAEATSYGVPRIASAISLTQAIVIEAILTFFLVSAVFGTAVSEEAPAVGGFAIGLVLLFDIIVGGSLTGAAMNPARAFGPALVSNDWHGHAAYWLGPALGAAAAALLWAKLLLPRTGGPAPRT